MSTGIEPLCSTHDLRAVVALQQQARHLQTAAVWTIPQLRDVQESGGLILRATDNPVTHRLQGTLVDLVAEADAYPARRTILWAVATDERNKGIGFSLRLQERQMLRRAGVDLVYWDMDPLSSIDWHLALNKLGGLATGYARHIHEEPTDSSKAQMSPDRIRIEWWLESPRVISRIDRGEALPHQKIGLDQMLVLTKTKLLSTGVRGLLACTCDDTSDHLLFEIPEDFQHLQSQDEAAAIQWRERSRDVLEQCFQLGYQGVGLIHEAGRSFILFKKGTRRTALGAVTN